MEEKSAMNAVQLKMGDRGAAKFFIEENGVQIAFLDARINGNVLTAVHTEVTAAAKGRGVAAMLVARMVEYAREKGMKIVPMCPYVRKVFDGHPEEYRDVCEG
ncbi:MAG TPA: GNAT family N-acetyltransferase [Candidatus Kapabacteria bacterium]